MDVQVLWVADHIAFDVGAHTHDFYQMAFCRKEGGTITIADKKYFAQKGYVYMMKSSIPHAMTKGDNMALIEIKFLVTDKETARKLPNEFCLIDNTEEMICRIATEALSGNSYSSETANAALKIFLAHAICEIGEQKPYSVQKAKIIRLFGTDSYTKSNSDILILGLKDYIEANLKREITVEELADKTFFNKTYFIKRFKILWGTTPLKFINDIRIEKAKSMLKDNKLSISYIAEECGFQSLHYFSRYFKKETGESPISYKKKYLLTTKRTEVQ